MTATATSAAIAQPKREAGWKAGFPSGAFPDRQRLKLAPSMGRPASSLHRPSCTSSSQRVILHGVRPQSRSRTALEGY
jgi:hypothetical protein